MGLGVAEQFLISALRLWGNGRGAGISCCCRNLLRNGFQAAGLLATAFEQFDRAITQIDASIIDAGWIAAMRDPALTHSEARYLRILALSQAGCFNQGQKALRVWLPAATARTVFSELAAFAKACAAVDIVLQSPAEGEHENESSVISLRPPRAMLH